MKELGTYNFFQLVKENKLSICSEQLAEFCCETPLGYHYAHLAIGLFT